MNKLLELIELKKAVREWLAAEFTPHTGKDGELLRYADTEDHGNPADCLQCRVEDLVR